MILNPLITIIIPTYNMAALLKDAINSVLSQTYQNWELLIIDNFSTDNTIEVINNFEDTRIKTFQLNNNGSIAISRNYGIKKALGDWIAFLDSDDIWYSNRLTTVLNNLNLKDLPDLITTNEVLKNVDTGYSKKLLYGRKIVDNLYESLLFYGNLFSPSSTLLRKKFIIKNSLLFRENKKFITAEDYDYWLLIAKHNPKVMSLNTIQGEFRVHSINNSKTNKLHSQNIKNVITDHIQSMQLSPKKKNKLIFNIETRLSLTQAKLLYLNTNRIKFFRIVILLFLNNPIFITRYLLLKLFRN